MMVGMGEAATDFVVTMTTDTKFTVTLVTFMTMATAKFTAVTKTTAHSHTAMRMFAFT